MDAEKIKQEVKNHYASIALQGGGCCGGGGSSNCCSGGAQEVSLVDYRALGATEGDLGLGCGLPTQYAAFRPGEVVLDLGSGAGVDVFLAARAVGPEGRAIGVDMTPEMIARAWENAVRGGYANVDFRLGEIEALPIESESVDVVLSNCVINLAPDKRRVFAEIWRVLKPGGRFSISDIVTFGDVPEEVRRDMNRWAECAAGALDRDEYLGLLREQGFTDLKVHSLVESENPVSKDYGFASLTVEGRKECC